jgi:CHAT domain-containing protein/tetratricopeptide (TPR) repeat protein
MPSRVIAYPTVILLICSVVYAQKLSDSRPIEVEQDLVSAILYLKGDYQSTASEMLKTHKRLVTPRLCNALLTAAATSSAMGNYLRSLFLCAVAKEAAIQLENKSLLGQALYRIGRTQFDKGDAKAAERELLVCKQVFEEVNSSSDLVYTLADLSAVQIYEAEYSKGEDYARKALETGGSEAARNGSERPGVPPPQYGLAVAWSSLGHAASWKGDYPSALECFNKSLTLWKELRQSGFWSAGNIADALIDIAHVYQAMGDHIRVLQNLSQAMEVAKTLLDQGRTATILNDLGVLYIEQGDFSKASEFLEQSREVFERLNNKREVARNLLNIGVVNQRQGKNAAALVAFQESLRKSEAIEAIELIIAAREGLGSVYTAEREYSRAADCLDGALLVAENLRDKIRMAELYWRKSQLLYDQSRYAESNAEAQKACEIADALQSPLLKYLALSLSARSYRAQGKLQAAVEAATQAIASVEQMRGQVAGAEREQQLFFENRISPYHEMVSILVQQGKTEDALKYAEHARARVLLDVLRNGRISINKSMSERDREEERRLYSEMVSLNTQIRAQRMNPGFDNKSIQQLENRLQQARDAYETFQATLYSIHPQLKGQRGVFPDFTMGVAHDLIANTKTAILEYVVTDETTFLFVLSRDSATASNIRINVCPIRIKRDALSAAVEHFRSLLSTNHPGFRQAGRDLYDLLVKPAEPFLRMTHTLCFIPDGPTWNLSFQAVQNERDQYLLENYAVYYAPSLQVLAEMKKKSETLKTLPTGRQGVWSSPDHLTPTLYAVGNPAVGGETMSRAVSLRNAPFVSLPETEKEVQSLETEVYGSKASLVRIGAAAREETVKAEMENYRVLHFATHGVLDDRNPLYSYLVLAPGNDSKEDGLLEAWELMQMDLKAKLAVLSACDTARGHIAEGEGIIGMTWAFFVAGVPATVASQWQVPSESTTKLMVAFHKVLVKSPSGIGTSAADAWRQAALLMINDPRYRMKPYYWAGFVLIGDAGH